MLENEITKDDIGSWYEMRMETLNGKYAKVISMALRNNKPVGIVYENGVRGSRFLNGKFHHTSIYGSDLARKLDPIEVNLLRLEQKLLRFKPL